MNLFSKRFEVDFFHPIFVYHQLRKDFFGLPSFLLHDGSSHSKSRYSILGFGVEREWLTHDSNEAFLMLEEMRAFLKKSRRDFDSDAPPFLGGIFGYLSYDLGADFQQMALSAADDFPTPKLHFIFPKIVLAYDHQTGELFIFGDVSGDFLKRIFDFNVNSHSNLSKPSFRSSLPQPDITPEEYALKIHSIHKLLRAGETYEVNFAQRFCADFEGDPFELYSHLMKINPSPYSCYFDFKPITIAGCSPELLIRGKFVERNGSKSSLLHLETRPIKGTVPRGANPKEDQHNIQRLFSSKKDEAELNMIVDLARNDLGRVCEIGSVEVNEHRVIESYSHVHHTMSNVRGILKSEYNWLDVLKAVFPGGSVTGAPKKRTIEIIDRLEPCRRGIYTGSAGYIGWDGSFEFNILIRTIALHREMGRLSFHSGGAIVMDSQPEQEYAETLSKAAALFEALAAQ